MATTDHATERAGTDEHDGLCDVCQERRARWTAAGQGQDFRICDPCRRGEPCGRCGAERDDCACREGPDLFTWLPVAARG